MDEKQLQLLIDLHRSNDRQGPGGDAETMLAMRLAGLDRSRPLRIADIGCGTGASAVLLAKELDAEVVAVDFLQDFLDDLRRRAGAQGVTERIATLNASMDELPFADESFDVVWSEGAVYNIGFERGIAAWRRFLKPGGRLVVSEMTWLTAERPAEIQRHWDVEYPEVAPVSAKIEILERHGYSPEACFVLPCSCWIENYYQPLQRGFDAFLARHGACREAVEIVEAERREIALYERYRDYYSYGVYIAAWPGR